MTITLPPLVLQLGCEDCYCISLSIFLSELVKTDTIKIEEWN